MVFPEAPSHAPHVLAEHRVRDRACRPSFIELSMRVIREGMPKFLKKYYFRLVGRQITVRLILLSE
jgi:hypothetical protein